ncbi:hypothetical protein VP14_239 [Vibrio phage VPMCC14]|nr:hypothetical protein VP14_239 [Vibrio phage VPMCC14]
MNCYTFLHRGDYIITLFRGCALPFKEGLYGDYPTLLPLGCTLLALQMQVAFDSRCTFSCIKSFAQDCPRLNVRIFPEFTQFFDRDYSLKRL